MAGSILLILCATFLAIVGDTSASKLLSQLRTNIGPPTNGNWRNVDRSRVGQHRTDEEKLAKKGDLGERGYTGGSINRIDEENLAKKGDLGELETNGPFDAELRKGKTIRGLTDETRHNILQKFYYFVYHLLEKVGDASVGSSLLRSLPENSFEKQPKRQLLGDKKRSSTFPIDKRVAFKTVDIYLLVPLLTFQLVLGNPDGAPVDACESMIPGHEVPAENSSSPFTITPSSPTYSCGASISVTLTGANFRGFLCQARTNVDDFSTTVGTLFDLVELPDIIEHCGEGRALTHSDNGDKSVVAFGWEPSTDHGSVTIVCSIVQREQRFWVKETSDVLTYGTNCTTTGASTVGSTQGAAGTTQSSTSNNNGTTTSSACLPMIYTEILLLIKLSRHMLWS